MNLHADELMLAEHDYVRPFREGILTSDAATLQPGGNPGQRKSRNLKKQKAETCGRHVCFLFSAFYFSSGHASWNSGTVAFISRSMRAKARASCPG